MEKKCRFCHRVCHKQEHLDRHERTHTKVRPYRCESCEKYFVRRYCYETVIGMTHFFSDTLKRHQKLHVTETQKESTRTSKQRVKRNSVDTNSDVSHFHRSIESPADQSSVHAVAEPQFCYYSLDDWKYPYLGSTMIDTSFSYVGIDEADTLFVDTSTFVDGNSSIVSAVSDLTVNPEYILEFI